MNLGSVHCIGSPLTGRDGEHQSYRSRSGAWRLWSDVVFFARSFGGRRRGRALGPSPRVVRRRHTQAHTLLGWKRRHKVSIVAQFSSWKDKIKSIHMIEIARGSAGRRLSLSSTISPASRNTMGGHFLDSPSVTSAIILALTNDVI